MGETSSGRESNLRDQQKAQTRAKVVAAARILFGEVGFAAATIREIAKRAGVAPGSVFTTFRSKEELLVEVLEERYTPLREAARAIMAADASFLDRTVQFFHAAYALEWPERKLVGEQFWVSWTFEPELDARARARMKPLLEALDEVIAQGVREGEVRGDIDRALLADMLFSVYLSNYRNFRDAALADVVASFARRAALLLQGAAPISKRAA